MMDGSISAMMKDILNHDIQWLKSKHLFSECDIKSIYRFKLYNLCLYVTSLLAAIEC